MLEPVYLIADENMHAIDFDSYKVKGLGTLTDPGSHAWVAFCCTHCGNAAFFERIYSTIITSVAMQIHAVYDFLKKELRWLQLDGKQPI